jgi:hypothetical protein
MRNFLARAQAQQLTHGMFKKIEELAQKKNHTRQIFEMSLETHPGKTFLSMLSDLMASSGHLHLDEYIAWYFPKLPNNEKVMIAQSFADTIHHYQQRLKANGISLA